MEKLARSKNTPATDASFDVLARIATDAESGDRYPSGTVLIPADSADASALISAAIAAERPISLVFADGSDVVARPPEVKGVLLSFALVALWLLDRAGRRRDRPTFVPREWVTEFHPAPKDRASVLVA